MFLIIIWILIVGWCFSKVFVFVVVWLVSFLVGYIISVRIGGCLLFGFVGGDLIIILIDGSLKNEILIISINV